MNSTTPAPGANPLMTLDSSAAAESKRSLLNPAMGDKSLNTQAFSDVLDVQRAAEKVAASAQVDDVLTDALGQDQALVSPSLLLTTPSPHTLSGNSGKGLPATTVALPLSGFSFTAVHSADSTPPGDVTDSVFEASTPQPGAGQAGVTATVTAPGINPPASLDGAVPMAPATTATTTTAPELVAANGDNSASAPSARTGRVDASARNQTSASGAIAPATESHAVNPAAIADDATGTLAAGATAALAVPANRSRVDATTPAASQLATTGSVVPELNHQWFEQVLVSQRPVAPVTPAAEQTLTLTPALEPVSDSPALNRVDASQAYRSVTEASPPAMAPVNINRPGWSDAILHKVMWMSSQQINQADIALDPPELGSLQVRVSTQSDQTSVVFSSQHSAVRDALDQGLPRLREMLEGQGLNLADVDVSDQGSQHPTHRESDAEAMAMGDSISTAQDDTSESSAQHEALLRQPSSLVDHYV